MPQVRTASRLALASNSGGGYFIRRVASPGASVGKCAVKPLARRAQTPFNNKENVPPEGAVSARPKRRSPLPDWYPRTPLRDITSIVKALEKRRSRLEEDVARQHIQWNEDSSEPVDPTTPVHAEHSDPQSAQTQEKLGVVATDPGSTSAIANVAEGKPEASSSPSDCSLQMAPSKPNDPSPANLEKPEASSSPSDCFLQMAPSKPNDPSPANLEKPEASSSPSGCSLQMAPSKPNDPSPADLEKKLSSSIKQIEKMVSRHMKETPKVAQPSRVAVQRRTLMSMR